MILEMFSSRRWWKTTLLVLAAIAVMIRLGIWQLDRLEQRRVFNDRVATQMAEDPLILSGQAIESDLYGMEYRSVIVRGEYDLNRQVVLRNQDWQGRLGVHILTPLMIDGGKSAVLVDRGWIPYEDFTSGKLDRYDVPGQSQIEGIIRRSQSKPAIGGRADQIPGPGEAPLAAWNWININDISQQIPYPLLPVYVTALPDSGVPQLPYRSELDLDLTEGPHLGYAFQWFIFAAILGIGYPVYINREEKRQASTRVQEEPYIQPGIIQNSTSEPDSKGYKQV
jgi:surfeit locus 1 family protein